MDQRMKTFQVNKKSNKYTVGWILVDDFFQIMRRRKKDYGLRRLVEDTLVPPDCRFFA